MSTRTGRVGDLICAAAIERVGGLASIVRTDGCDIIAYYDHRWFRVEVKSTVRPEQRGRKNHYYFMTSTGAGKKKALSSQSADIVALTANDLRMVYFLPIKSVRTVTKRLRAELFSPAQERQSWIDAVNRIS